MHRAAPRIPWQVVQALGRLDDPRRPIAETWRRACALSTELGVPRPSYEQIRRLVTRERALRATPGTTVLLVDLALQARSPQEILRRSLERTEERRHRLEGIRRERAWRPDAGGER